MTRPGPAAIIFLVVLAAASVAAQPASRIQPQELGLVYAEQRFKAEFFAALEGYERIVEPRPSEQIKVDADTLSSWIMRQAYNYEPPASPTWQGQVNHWEVISPDRTHLYVGAFQSSDWSYLGANYFTPLDTTRTEVIRAHLESRFGGPSLTLVELGSAGPHLPMQFDYWIVANDSIHVRVMDSTGPLDRGIIFAAKSKYRSILFNLRQSLLGDLIHRTDPTPYADYYYSPASERWYFTGFDGTSFRTRRIRAPRLTNGRPEPPPN